MQASTELRNVFHAWFRSVAAGDASWVERHVSSRSGVRLVGIEPAEWLEGPEVAGYLKSGAAGLGGVVQVAPGEIEAYSEGTVGWGLACPILTLSSGRQLSPRWSAVFHQEDGAWKLVQFHASLGMANEVL